MNLKSLLTLFIFCSLLALLACGKDSPLAPEEAPREPILADFMPLHLGYTANYDFVLDYRENSAYLYLSHHYEGTCEISVTEELDQDTVKYLRISASYFFVKDINVVSYLTPGLEDNDVHDSTYNYTSNCQYDLLQAADSLWYVTDTLNFSDLKPDFSRKLVLCYLKESGGINDLNPFLWPGWWWNPFKSAAELKGDSLIYNIDVYGGTFTQNGMVKLLKNEGLESIDYTVSDGIDGSLSGIVVTHISYTRQR